MSDQDLEQAIIATICYFDLFDYPLTLLELSEWLFICQPPKAKTDLTIILQALEESSVLSVKIKSQDGFYFLAGRESIIVTRLARYALTNFKNKIALRGAAILRFLPFIKLVGLCNNAGYNNIRADSDIDLFIITANRRLFTARFLITLVLSLWRLRRHGRHITNRLCLSFYASEDSLDFSKIKIAEPDIYLVYWIANLFPLYDQAVYEKFLAQNKWIKDYLPNFLPKAGSCKRRSKDNPLAHLSARFLAYLLDGYLGDLVELFLKKIQFIKMSQNKHSLAQAGDSRVVISDTMLKFHENDRRLSYQNNFQAKLKEINL